MSLNYNQGGLKTLYEKASINDNNKVSSDFNMDAISIFNENKATGNNLILKFPNDIENDIKKNKSLSLFILKDAAYQEIINAGKVALNVGLESQSVKGSKAEAAIREGLKTTKVVNGETVNKSTLESIKDVSLGLAQLASVTPQATMDAISAGSDYFSNATKLDLKNISSEKFHCVIKLPIPNNLTEDDGHSYEDANGITEEAKNLLPDIITKTAGNLYGIGDSLAQSSGQIMQGAARRSSQQLAQLPILNPYTWRKFKGSRLKDFKFTFFFVPRNKSEAEKIMKIIYTLKKYSYGSKSPSELSKEVIEEFNSYGQGLANVAQDATVSAPPKVLLQFNNPMLNKLLNPGICVIDSITLTYNEGNTVGMTLDGVPRFIEMNLNLCECNVRFQEDFNTK